jgi:hypothetical protein
MKVYVASLVDLENTVIVGVYTNKKLAMEKLNSAMDELMDKNEDLGVYPSITEKNIDDVEKDEYV